MSVAMGGRALHQAQIAPIPPDNVAHEAVGIQQDVNFTLPNSSQMPPPPVVVIVVGLLSGQQPAASYCPNQGAKFADLWVRMARLASFKDLK
jgi:hypothetical protein